MGIWKWNECTSSTINRWKTSRSLCIKAGHNLRLVFFQRHLAASYVNVNITSKFSLLDFIWHCSNVSFAYNHMLKKSTKQTKTKTKQTKPRLQPVLIYPSSFVCFHCVSLHLLPIQRCCAGAPLQARGDLYAQNHCSHAEELILSLGWSNKLKQWQNKKH